MSSEVINRIVVSSALCLLVVMAALAQEPSASTTNIFIQMLPRGMDPQQVTVTHGKITMLVQNRSTAPNVKLNFAKTGANAISSVSLLPHQHHSMQTFTLSPGTYVLSESYHKNWSCTITVQ